MINRTMRLAAVIVARLTWIIVQLSKLAHRKGRGNTERLEFQPFVTAIESQGDGEKGLNLILIWLRAWKMKSRD